MYFAPFQQNAFQIIANIQNYEAFQNYQNQIPSYMLTVSQPVTDLFQWNQLFSAQNCSLQEKPMPITQLVTQEGYSQSQVIVETSKTIEPQKKKDKKSAEKDISSAKKNSQSNIINQYYSHFSCKEKSAKIVIKAIQASMPNTKFQQKIMLLFYNTIKAINSKRGRKYVNRSMMLNYFTPDMLIQNLPQLKQKFEKIDFITMDQLCQIFRRSCHAFLKIASIPAIMTSKRITGVSKEEHFKKRRIILKAITGY